jgi:hypothetical protein
MAGMEETITVEEAARRMAAERTAEGIESAVAAMASKRRGSKLSEAHRAALKRGWAARRERLKNESAQKR